MSGVYRIESISQLHAAIGYPKPLHPLISLIDYSKIEVPSNLKNVSVISVLYSIVPN